MSRVLGALFLVALVACQAEGGGTADATGSSFALTSCDDATACPGGFECAAFPCAADCAADSDGRCDAACQAGPMCLPLPPVDCDPAACGPGQVCTRSCSGGCDATTAWCEGVACEITCQPVTVPPEVPPGQACVTDFTDACLPPDYPVAARLDDVCAEQGMVLTDVSVAAECWPGAVQFKWTCCRGEVVPPPVDPGQGCVGGVVECIPPDAPAKDRIARQCADQGLQLAELTASPCENGFVTYRWSCCGSSTTPPPAPWCDMGCDAAGNCWEKCCDPATGQCWSNEYPGQPTEPPTEVCVQGATRECLPNTDPKMQAYEACAAQNLELRDLYEIGQCPDGMPMFAWTCCGPATTPPPPCGKVCDANGVCYETCCDATGQCTTTTYPGSPVPPDPDACLAQVAGGDGTCTDLETLLAYAAWTCAASGLTLADNGPWGECNGGWQGLKFLCCP